MSSPNVWFTVDTPTELRYLKLKLDIRFYFQFYKHYGLLYSNIAEELRVDINQLRRIHAFVNLKISILPPNFDSKTHPESCFQKSV